MAIHSSILAWKSPWTEDPGGLQSVGSQRVGHDWVTKHKELLHSVFTFPETYSLMWADRVEKKSLVIVDIRIKDNMCKAQYLAHSRSSTAVGIINKQEKKVDIVH